MGRSARCLLIFVLLLSAAAYCISPLAVRQGVEKALDTPLAMAVNDGVSADRDGDNAAPMPNESYEIAQANAVLLQYHPRSLHEFFPASHR